MKQMFLGILLSISMLTSCSYVTDAIERELSDRSSFEITSVYDPSSKTVSLTWDEGPSDSSTFAGIEIFRTKTADNEYEDYELVESPYQKLKTSGGYDSVTNPFLLSSSTKTYSQSVSDIANGIDTRHRPGTYYYRIAFVKWNDSSRSDYFTQTILDKASGSANVCIY